MLHLVLTLRGYALQLSLGRESDDCDDLEDDDTVVGAGGMYDAAPDLGTQALGFSLPPACYPLTEDEDAET